MEDETYRVQLASDYMERVRSLRRRKLAAMDVYSELTGLRGIDYSRESMGGSCGSDALLEIVEQRTKARREVEVAISEYDDALMDAWRRINMLETDTHVRVLTLRYIKDTRWDSIAKILHCSRRAAMESRRCALLELYDRLPNDCKAPKSS